MAIVHRQLAVRRYRYGGSGIIDAIARAILSSGSKAISSGVSSAAPQKVANVVVSGANTAAKESAKAALRGAALAAQKAGEKAVNAAIHTVANKGKRGVKNLRKYRKTASKKIARELEKTPLAKAITSARKININSLIDGSGVILD